MILKVHRAGLIIPVTILSDLLPFFSYKVIPFTAALLTVDAKLHAVTAFRLVSPLMNTASFLITSSMIGWDFAITKTVSAVRISVLSGPIKMEFFKKSCFFKPIMRKSKGWRLLSVTIRFRESVFGISEANPSYLTSLKRSL